jgi:signal transduction histidine kinase
MAGADADRDIGTAQGDDAKDHLIATLQERNAALAAAVTARDTFLSVAAHELRNPMTPIIGQVQRLRRQLESGACSLVEVEKSVKRIEWLVDIYLKRATTLLDVSRITTGKLRLELSDFDVSALARSIAESMEAAVHYSGSTLSVRVEDGLQVHADRLALEQILDNILLNAIKYGAGEPITLAVFSRGEEFCLEVRDCGVGMSPADRQRIFEPFERAIAYTTKAGFGVGLWVVRQLVDAMGGRIEVESTPGEGTTFAVTLRQRIEPQS